ncbi:MAG: hypothetical protein CML60_07200 [Rhodobacteraceae bacterium]|nr:hypothetical protein [Paracoccaceae bacterium]
MTGSKVIKLSNKQRFVGSGHIQIFLLIVRSGNSIVRNQDVKWFWKVARSYTVGCTKTKG